MTKIEASVTQKKSGTPFRARRMKTKRY
jgi:hypothetical protein